jgi:hypothetical protein
MAASDDNHPRLLPGEKVVMTTAGVPLTLTNLRVFLDETERGESRYLTVTLDAVASCGVVTRTLPFLLGIAAVAGIGGLIQITSEVGLVLIGIAAILVVAFFTSRSAMLTISSTGGEHIAVPAKGIGRREIIQFIDAVDAAKVEFLRASGR